ncbi:hypothetical protein IMCC3317_08550 [Kordia antarctica]|uniref:DUF1697 domain-containing protein n=1 Tax=Kordia antarctica TaxID=1218801 RepID=A0A7L4ZGF4_9FLAO|nr:hypothetical protein IMCC3317_08550 [Kordia antarctica]
MSGHRRIKMDALRQLYSDLGFENVKTYIQSGNVVFQFKQVDNKKLADRIEMEITKRFEFQVPVLVKEINELKEIVNQNPFLKDTSKDISFLHVTFLSDIPTKENLDKIISGQYQQDEFQIFEKSVYLYCPNSYSNSKLTNSFFESKLKVTATTRNWKTTNELINISDKL